MARKLNKDWIPKNIRKTVYAKKPQKVLDEWFISYANLANVSKETGIARSTLYRWSGQMKEKEALSLQDLVTVTVYRKLIELENEDWKKYTELKESQKEIKVKLSKQAKDLTAQLKAQGFDVKIKAPTKAVKTKKVDEFANILVLDSSSDLEKRKQARGMFNKLGKAKQQAYMQYKMDHLKNKNKK